MNEEQEAMRDPSRIPELMAELQRVWYKYPNLSFCQLMDNLLTMYYQQTTSDPFHIEDIPFMEWLQKRIN